MHYPETIYEQRKRLEAAITHDKKMFKVICVIAAILLCLVIPIFLCWFLSKPHQTIFHG